MTARVPTCQEKKRYLAIKTEDIEFKTEEIEFKTEEIEIEASQPRN